MSERIYDLAANGKLVPMEEIVRCYECIHRIFNDVCIVHLHSVEDDDFCSEGRRAVVR